MIQILNCGAGATIARLNNVDVISQALLETTLKSPSRRVAATLGGKWGIPVDAPEPAKKKGDKTKDVSKASEVVQSSNIQQLFNSVYCVGVVSICLGSIQFRMRNCVSSRSSACRTVFRLAVPHAELCVTLQFRMLNCASSGSSACGTERYLAVPHAELSVILQFRMRN